MMTAPSSNWCTRAKRASAVSSQPSATRHVGMDALVREGEQGSPLVVGFPRTLPGCAGAPAPTYFLSFRRSCVFLKDGGLTGEKSCLAAADGRTDPGWQGI